MRKNAFACLIFILSAFSVNAFDEGFIWGLKANFNGSATMPWIDELDLDKIGAAYMDGAVGYTMDGEAELGYLFGSERWFGGMGTDKFSGMSIYGAIGVGSGFAGQVAGNTIEGITVNMFINVNYAPVISFGVGTKAYFLDSKLAIGFQVGGKVIADLSPEYLAYADADLSGLSVTLPAVGEIVVTDFMMKNMNPFMFSLKLSLEYNQPINDRVEVVLGIYGRYNIFVPKYITMPDSLLKLLQAVRPNFTTETPLPSYMINSLDFGLSLGLQFKG